MNITNETPKQEKNLMQLSKEYLCIKIESATKKAKLEDEKAKEDKLNRAKKKAQEDYKARETNYINEVKPHLSKIIAEVLRSTLKIEIDAVSVFCDFFYLDNNNNYIWKIECSIGSTNVSLNDSRVLIRHMERVLDNIRTNAISDFNATFRDTWSRYNLEQRGSDIRCAYFCANYLRLWDIKVNALSLSNRNLFLTVYLRETPEVGYFARSI